ncbi:MAG: hypothetical protein PHE36_10195 [Novosphingobium sp.]|nr:hypothetical protein [Novosphingobium sp.]
MQGRESSARPMPRVLRAGVVAVAFAVAACFGAAIGLAGDAPLDLPGEAESVARP